MERFDLDAKLMQFGTGDDLSQDWCIKHSILGCQVFGSNGSGKSSSMRTLALKYLRAGYGFLVLSVKSERETWEEYCKLAGRSDDLIIIGEKSPHRFDFMRYLSDRSNGGAFTSNLLNILYTVIKAGDQIEGGNSADPFWEKSTRLLLHNTISLCQLANAKVSIEEMYNIIQSAPNGSDDGAEEKEKDNPDRAFNKAFETIRSSIAADYQQWTESWSDGAKQWFSDRQVREAAFLEIYPRARTFKFVEQFFFETFKSLSYKTKSVILMGVSSFLFSLLQDPIYTLFCSGKITVTPEDSLAGKVVVLDLPTKFYYGAGRCCQLLYKHIWQLQVEKRDITKNARPVCLWSDESAEFITEHDPVFQSTARSSRIAVVYICQNVHQYYSALSGP
ncbi:hypothetical protein [Hufsiella ginkgonis]|uniref:Uncharacterized protein n=1 Tax=Hufsiella ginkgonis TaxID=2695274 RepID=A0A7K1Y0Y2_9SPHI|nr:hypothetical protein [Hufsiella ginkgonis]MXV16903.1 hypothetical protein [Hufsiella ginkgonis]